METERTPPARLSSPEDLRHGAPLPEAPPEWLQPAMAVNGIGSFAWDIREGTIDWDALASRILGVRSDELGRDPDRLLQLLEPADADLVVERVKRAVEEESQVGAYLRLTAPEGEQRSVRFRARVIRDPDDDLPIRMIGFVWEAEAEQRKRHRNDRQLAARHARSDFLQEASRSLAEATTVYDVARVFSRLPFPDSAPDGRVLALLDGGRMEVVDLPTEGEQPVRVMNGAGLDAPHPGVTAVREHQPVFLDSPEQYQREYPDAWPYAEAFGRRAWAFLPLLVGGRVLAVCMVSYLHEREFSEEDRALLTTVAGLIAQALGRARLHDAEHELATGLQQVLLPRRVPQIPGLHTAVRYLPAGSGLHIGGDWYDVIQVPGGRTVLVVGDVQGHDVHAAGVMGQLRVALRAYAAEGHPPEAVLSRACRFLADLDTGLFATCVYVDIDVARDTVDVLRAGHPDPVVRHADGSSTVRGVPGGLPLGVDPDESYPVTRIDLDPGDTLLLASNGLLESRRADPDAGVEHLREVLADPIEAFEQPAEEAADFDEPLGEAEHPMLEALADRIIDDAADEAGREDDIALLLMRWDAVPDGTGTRWLRRTVAQADLARISEVRADLREAAQRWNVADLADTAELLVSEVVTNALVHTDGDTVLTVQLSGSGGRRRLRVEVEDDSGQWLRRRTPGEQASSGRGLLLVEQLADAWGVQPKGDGKRVWFELSEDSTDLSN